MKILLLGSFFLAFFFPLSAQKTSSYSTYSSFIEYQKAIPRMGEAFKRKEDTLQKQFEKKGLVWPAKYLYLRSFKYDSLYPK